MDKATTQNGTSYNFNELSSPNKFEEIVYKIFKAKIEDTVDSLSKNFDGAYQTSSVGESGVDIFLTNKNEKKAYIQCKMNTSGTLSKIIFIEEIIKITLHYYQNNTLLQKLENSKYYFVISGKFATSTINLISTYKTSILKEKELKKNIESVIKKYKTFESLTYNDVKDFLNTILPKIDVIPVSGVDLNQWITKYPHIIQEFFEIKKVTDNSIIESLVQAINPDIELKINNFLVPYYKVLCNHLESIKFIGHDVTNRPKNVTVSKLYVEPNLLSNKKINKLSDFGEIEQNEGIKTKVSQIFDIEQNYIILGDPGAGKSLMVKNLILRIAKKSALTGGLQKYKNYIPFRIELRKYNETKRKENINILTYLVFLIKNEYQMDVDLKTLEYLLSNKNTMFFFDGLDEIFDISQKNVVCDDITNFITVYEKTKCLITSRFVGYQDVSFSEEYFHEFAIQNFNEEQIDKFIDKFYSTQYTNKNEREEEANNCKKQLKTITNDLKGNPLILSLMAILAINKTVIPASRLDVYRACTSTLVDTRDRDEKNLDFQLKVKSKRGTLGNLAYWQYCQMTEKNKITRNLSKKSIASYLTDNKEFSVVYKSR